MRGTVGSNLRHIEPHSLLARIGAARAHLVSDAIRDDLLGMWRGYIGVAPSNGDSETNSKYEGGTSSMG